MRNSTIRAFLSILIFGTLVACSPQQFEESDTQKMLRQLESGKQHHLLAHPELEGQTTKLNDLVDYVSVSSVTLWGGGAGELAATDANFKKLIKDEGFEFVDFGTYTTNDHAIVVENIKTHTLYNKDGMIAKQTKN